MRKAEKIELAKGVRERLESAKAVFLSEYRGLTVEQVAELRKNLREIGAEARVIKNRLFRKAAEGMGMEGLEEYLSGPTIYILHDEEGVSPAKALMSFAKENEFFLVKAGFLDGNIMDAKGVETLSKLPSREELQGSILYNINSAMAVVVTAIESLLQEIGGLVIAQEKALGGEEAEASAAS